MTYREAVARGKRLLEEKGIADAGTDAWLLLETTCGIDRNYYYLHMQENMTQDRQTEYENVLKKRAEHIPLQYITGEQEFMGLRFRVNSSVLIPRQDTETLVEEALGVIRPGMEVLDLCTGSGCIIISLVKNVPSLKATASDISRQALLVARENAKQHGTPVQFQTGDLLEPIQGRYDVIVSNPPYIRTEELAGLMPEVRDFEPREALDGREDGLYFYRRIVRDAKKHLKPGGYLMLEIGCEQGEAVSELMRQSGYGEIKVRKDLAGLDRVVTGKEMEHV